MVNITDCKPDDQICVNETDLNVDFDPPLDYVEPVVKPLRPSKSTQEREVKATYDKKIDEVA